MAYYDGHPSYHTLLCTVNFTLLFDVFSFFALNCRHRPPTSLMTDAPALFFTLLAMVPQDAFPWA